MADAGDQTRIHLIESDEQQPLVRLRPGKRYEVLVTPVVDSNLDKIAEQAEDPALRPARLCGSRSTCLAIVEIE